jgi:rubrerythrin
MQTTFDSALRGLRLTGASVDTRALVELIARHGTEEGQLLATYEDLASTTSDEGVRYLIGLILEDERRHHRLLAEIANSMAWGSTAGRPKEATPGIPRGLEGELLEQTRRLLKAEQTDHRELRRIRRRLRPFADTTLWALVIDLMLLDTKKHATILRFLERHRRSR